MKKQTLNLKAIKIESFVTTLEKNESLTVGSGEQYTYVCSGGYAFCPTDVHSSCQFQAAIGGLGFEPVVLSGQVPALD